MADRIDMLLAMQTRTHDAVTTLDEKVETHILSTEGRLTSVESRLRLRSRIGGAIVVLLPALVAAFYLLIPFIFGG